MSGRRSVLRLRGIGVIALLAAIALGYGLGRSDFDWLAEALPRYRRSMEYVHDKAEHDEVQPESDFPIGESLAESATSTVGDFPDELTEALETDDAMSGAQFVMLHAESLRAVRIGLEATVCYERQRNDSAEIALSDRRRRIDRDHRAAGTDE